MKIALVSSERPLFKGNLLAFIHLACAIIVQPWLYIQHYKLDMRNFPSPVDLFSKSLENINIFPFLKII
jgi:hypothetical protein